MEITMSIGYNMRSFLRKLRPITPRASTIHKYVYMNCDPSKCYYCSRPARAYDHVLPVSVAELLPDFPFPSEILQLVPCCTRCNSIAGNKFFSRLSAKQDYILQRLYELKVRAMIDRMIRALS